MSLRCMKWCVLFSNSGLAIRVGMLTYFSVLSMKYDFDCNFFISGVKAAQIFVKSDWLSLSLRLCRMCLILEMIFVCSICSAFSLWACM